MLGMALALVLSFSGSSWAPQLERSSPVAKSAFELGFARVMGAMLQFRREPSLPRARELEQSDRDRLRAQTSLGDVAQQQALGAGIFAAMTMLVAHAPKQVRVLFDRDLHLGPALLPGGALGVGCGLDF